MQGKCATMRPQTSGRRVALQRAVIAAASIMLLPSVLVAGQPQNAAAAERAKTPERTGSNSCAAYGPRAKALGDTNVCVLTSAGVMAYVFKEFTDTDIEMIGQRIPVPFLDAGLPLAFYHKKDISYATNKVGFGAIATADLMLVHMSQAGLLRGYVRASFDGRSDYDEDGKVGLSLPKIDDSYYYGALNEAWVQFNGLKVGIQPSLFGFNRVPSILNPTYTSQITTAAASFTIGYARNFTVSISAEDGSRRNYTEGILSREFSKSMNPDWVGLVRYATGKSLYHFSAARHEVYDTVVRDFSGKGNKTPVSGWAVAAGVQTKVTWDEYFGERFKRTPGRLSLTFAAADGAIGYLGIPFFAPDYVVSSSGEIERSSGWSAVAAYEHVWAPAWKSTLSYSYFSVEMGSPAEAIIPTDIGPLPLDVPATMMDFDIKVRGSVLQGGIEHMLAPGVTAGLEVGYTWTEAEGRYGGHKAQELSVGYPHVGFYLRRAF